MKKIISSIIVLTLLASTILITPIVASANIIIPNDKKIEHEIKNILEEREREEFSRLKVIKNKK